VFNLAQVDRARLPADGAPALPEGARILAAEALFARMPGLDLRHGGTAAFYSPASDHVQLPRFTDFHDAPGYYAMFAHEVGHWTGYPSCLARNLSGRFGGAACAGEELVAAFACPGLELATEPRADHARYVAHCSTCCGRASRRCSRPPARRKG
jgi:antirestriction protein ArdC